MSSIFYGISPLIVFLTICIILKKILVGICIISPFISIRIYSGGYHASNYILCFILSLSSLLALMCISKCNISTTSLILLIFISLFTLAKYSPVIHYNNQVTDKELFIYKKRAIIICIFWILICFLLLILSKKELFTACSSSIILSALSILPCIHQKNSSRRHP